MIINNNDEIISKFDNLILSEEIYIKEEGLFIGQGNPVSKNEISDLFKFEESMCKISFERIENKENKIIKGKGTGFFCEINGNFPIKYGLFTNNHILNEYNLKLGSTIYFEYFSKSKSNYTKKELKLDDNRNIYTNKKLDYTCIEIFKSDKINDINNYFKIDPILFTNNKILKDSDIFILQYPKNNELNFSFSYGKILSLKENLMIHSASTDEGSSGSPIIRRCNENYIIGLHKGGYLTNYFDKNEDIDEKKEEKNICFVNISTIFDSILNDINKNEINCIYYNKDNENEIQLLHDYKVEDFTGWRKEYINLYLEAKKMNRKIFEENIEIYINGNKIPFNYKYKVKGMEKINVKFKIKRNLTNISYMFFHCYFLESLDLSSFNSNNVTKMICLVDTCISLNSINLSLFNTNNVINMAYLFKNCISLKTLDLTPFNTNNVNYMNNMFFNCRSLESIDLSSFNTKNVINMRRMFSLCSSLKSLDLSSFNINNDTDMSEIFYGCSSLNKNNIKIDKQDMLLNYII